MIEFTDLSIEISSQSYISMNTESIKSLKPEKLSGEDDLDIFIKNCERYFEVNQAWPHSS